MAYRITHIFQLPLPRAFWWIQVEGILINPEIIGIPEYLAKISIGISDETSHDNEDYLDCNSTNSVAHDYHNKEHNMFQLS